MIGTQTAEVVDSLKHNLGEWECIKITKDSTTLKNSPVILGIWGDLLGKPEDLLAFYHVSDKRCLISRENMALLPALFALDLTLTVLERINDVAILKKIERLANQSGKFSGPFWKLK